jgi:cell division protein FtsB
MSTAVLQMLKHHKGLLLGAGMALTLGWAAVSGSQGLDGMLEKRAQIKQLQEENAAIEAENAARQARIERLETSPSDQDLEIRRLNMLKQGETVFMLPENEKNPAKRAKKH